MSESRVLRLLGLLLAVGLFAAACSSDDDSGSADGGGEADGASLVLDGEECTYEGPTELSESPLVVSVENQSDSDANFGVLSLGVGNDASALELAIQERESSEQPALGADVGVTASTDVPPGESSEMTAITPVGNYALVCTNFEGGIPFEISSPVTFVASPVVVEVTG